MASLFVIQGADQGKRFEFMSSLVSLGRDLSNTVRLHADHEVSRRHAELRLDREGYRIVDLGSANGTYVNGQPIDQTPLRPGDRVQLGQTVMLFHLANDGDFPAILTARVDLLTKEQARGPLRHPQEHPFRRRLASSASPGRRRRLASRSADELVGHVSRHPGHHQCSGHRHPVAPNS